MRSKKRRGSPPREEGPRQQLLRKRRRSLDDGDGEGQQARLPPAKRVEAITESMEDMRVGSTYPQWVQLGAGVPLPNQLGGGGGLPAGFGGGGGCCRTTLSGPGGGVLMPLYRPMCSPTLSPRKRSNCGSPTIDLSYCLEEEASSPRQSMKQDVPPGEECEEDEDGCLSLITPGAKAAMRRERHLSPSGYVTEEEEEADDDEDVMDLDAV